MADSSRVLDILRSISERTWAKRYWDGEVIFNQDDVANEGIAFVLKGEVRIVQYQGTEGVVLGRVRPGEVFGEAAYILGRSRGATAVAEGVETIIIFFDQASFMAQANEYFDLVLALWNQAVSRIENVLTAMSRIHDPFSLVVDPSIARLIAGNRASNLRVPALLGHSRRSYFAKNQAIFQQGQRNDGSIFLLVEGQISAERNFGGHENKEVYRLEPGDFFGYSNLKTSPIHLYSAVPREESIRLVMFDSDHFFHLMKENTDLFWIVIRSILTQLVILDDSLRLAITRLRTSPGSEQVYKEVLAAFETYQTGTTPPLT